MAQEYVYEQCKEADRDASINLMGEIFVTENMRKAHDFNSDFWRWQYQENPSGNAIIILAKDNNRVIGQYANVPVHLKFDDQVLKSSLTIDLMVRKEYRRQGLFKKMGEVSNNNLSESGISLSVAFPSRNESYAGFIHKLGWLKVGNLEVLVKPVFFNLFGSAKTIAGTEIKEISSFPEAIDGVWKRLNPNITIGIIRDSKYLNWRYSDKPNGKYQKFLVYRNNMLVGYFVLKFLHLSKLKLGVIVDMLCVNEMDIVKAIILKNRELCLKHGAYFCAVLKTKLYENTLRQLGFRVLPSRISPKGYTLIIRTNKHITEINRLTNIDNWYLTFGDWDVV